MKNLFATTILSQRKIQPFSIFIFLIPIALIRLSDAILSYIFPIILESHVNSNLITGFIMALSSVVGLMFDLLLPLIFKNKTWKVMLISAIVVSLSFPVVTVLGDIFGFIWIFLLAVILWGIYYEFILFTEQTYVVEEEKKENYSKIWGVIGVMIDVTGILAPILGSLLLAQGKMAYTSVVLMLEVIALVIALIFVSTDQRKEENKHRNKIKEYVSLFKELKYWNLLSKKIIPLLTMALVLELVSASFWIFGGLFGKEVIGIEGWDWLVLVVSIVPALIGSLIVSRLRIRRRKKRISQISLMIGGLCLAPIALFEGNPILILLTIFISSFLMSFAWPLNDAVYSDLQERLDEKGIHLMGLSNAGYSIAYIIAPIFMGLVADTVGYHKSFSILGILVFVISFLLVIFTPRKLLMPHQKLDEIK